MTVSPIPAFDLEFEERLTRSTFTVVITFTDSLEEVSGTFNSSRDEFEPSWFSSDEAEELYDQHWEDIEKAIIDAYYK
jgi:hypothetical protein